MCALDESAELDNELGEDWGQDPSRIRSVLAMFKNFSLEKLVDDAVIYFWESHTENPDDEKNVKATEDLIYKLFDVVNCEKYEVRTGYLSRHNYLSKSWDEATEEDVEKAINKGYAAQKAWLDRCKPNLPGFVQYDWKDCISNEKNKYYEECKELIKDRLKTSEEFQTAFMKSVDSYATRHNTLQSNGKIYILEEITWIMSLSLLHVNKQIYLIHVGNDNPAIKEMFHQFPNLSKAVKWLSPRCRTVSFANIADFLMYYRSNGYAGCSFARENPSIVRAINSFADNGVTKEKLSFMLSREQAEKEFLLSIIGKIPGHVYWLSRNNVYLGCNDLQAHDFGLDAKEEVIGKTNKDLLPSAEAEALDKTNQMVMESGESYIGEENASMFNGYKNYLTTKTPLFDNHGKVVGLLGLSVDITDRKRAEALEIKNQLQESKLQSQREFNQFIARMAHDITSPLIGLEAFTKSCSVLTENQHTLLRNVATNIRSISKALLVKHKENERNYNSDVVQTIPMGLALSEIIAQKQQEFARKDVKIHCFIDNESRLAFVNMNRISFDRMVSNLVNNSFDAAEGKHCEVGVSLKSYDSFVELQIKDNGKGMPKEMVDKILKGNAVGTTKSDGHGIGMSQILGVISRYEGKIAIESVEGQGTTINIRFPLSEIPSWFTKKITFKKGSLILVLDNDEVMHEVWRKRLENLGLNVKYFLKWEELSTFVESLPKDDRDNLTLLCDYDLRSSKSGLIVVLELGLKKQTIMVTGVTNDSDFFELVQKIGLKVILKPFIDELEIVSK